MWCSYWLSEDWYKIMWLTGSLNINSVSPNTIFSYRKPKNHEFRLYTSQYTGFLHSLWHQLEKKVVLKRLKHNCFIAFISLKGLCFTFLMFSHGGITFILWLRRFTFRFVFFFFVEEGKTLSTRHVHFVDIHILQKQVSMVPMDIFTFTWERMERPTV